MTRGRSSLASTRRAHAGAVLAGALLAGATLFAALLSGCSDLHVEPLPTVGSSASDPVIANPSFAGDIQPIFTARCALAGCHITPTEANLGLVLKDAHTSYTNLVNVDSVEQPGVKRVAPGDVPTSYLMAKLASGEMPKSGPMLSMGTIFTIANWIEQGAPDN